MSMAYELHGRKPVRLCMGESTGKNGIGGWREQAARTDGMSGGAWMTVRMDEWNECMGAGVAGIVGDGA